MWYSCGFQQQETLRRIKPHVKEQCFSGAYNSRVKNCPFQTHSIFGLWIEFNILFLASPAVSESYLLSEGGSLEAPWAKRELQAALAEFWWASSHGIFFSSGSKGSLGYFPLNGKRGCSALLLNGALLLQEKLPHTARFHGPPALKAHIV